MGSSNPNRTNQLWVTRTRNLLGREINQHKDFSDHTANVIDQRVRSLIDQNYQRAEEILKTNIKLLHAMAEALIKYETIGTEQIEDLMAGDDLGHLKAGATSPSQRARKTTRKRKKPTPETTEDHEAGNDST